MELHKELFGLSTDTELLKSLDFCISQFESSKLTLSEIQHKKVLEDIDMDFEELIEIILSCKKYIVEINSEKKDE